MKGFLASLMMLTRLPLWKIIKVDPRYYSDTLKYWPLVGFVTGFTTLGTYWLASLCMPLLPASVIAILSRLLLTGALHEDGLADFLDGFGGGNSKEQILTIMKDSHIGSYGTIGLILYFLTYVSFLASFDPYLILPVILAADVLSKLCASIMIGTLGYVRKAEESKTKLIYRKIHWGEYLFIAFLCLIPFLFLRDPFFLLALFPAVFVTIALRIYLKKKIWGYTGHCCGASVLIIEQSFYLGCIIIYYW